MKINKVLVVHTAFVGDVILITPLLKYIKNEFPAAEIDVLVIPQTKDILKNNPHLNDVIVFDKKQKKITSFAKTVLRIRSNNYDMAFLPHSSLTTALLIFLAGIKTRIGFDRWLAAKFLTHKIPFQEGKHRIEKNLDLLRAFSKTEFDIQTELFPGAKDKEKAEKILAGINSGKKKIVLAPGSVWFTKCWLESYYKELSGNLAEKGFFLFFIGSKAEQDLCQRILPPENAVNLAGKTTLLEAAAILGKCELLVCNDSGALHLANAMRTDVLAIFGPTIKEIGYFPFREHDLVFEVDLDCRPCGSHGGKKCPLGHHDCMKLITPDLVLEKILERFE